MGAVLIACALAPRPALADDASRIVGTWKLVSVVYQDVATGEKSMPLGAHPVGYQLATAAGRWIAVVNGEGRAIPATEAERSAALLSMIAYTGRWHVEGDKIVTHVDAAWQPAWVGTDQIRQFHFDGDDTLVLASPPQPQPNLLGKMVRLFITWQREPG
jgi:cytidine deaminase